MGLAQGRRPRGFNIAEDFEVGPIIVDVFSQAQHITEKAFSTRLSGPFGDSFVDFGPEREEEMSSKGEQVEIPMNKGFFYSTIPQGIRFGDAAEGQAFGLNGAEAILTTGNSISMVPASLSSVFFKRLLKDVEAEQYYEDNGVFYASCGTPMKDLFFMLEEHWVQIKGSDLLMDISEKQDNTLCIVNFLPSVDEFWVFGNPIYKDYYVYHNPDSAMTKWVPTAQRFKDPLEKGAPPTAEIQFGYDWNLVYLKLAIVIVAMVGTGATAQFVFVSTFPGVSFLNKSSRKTSDKLVKEGKAASIAKKLESMSTEKLEKLLLTVKQRR